VAVVHFHQRRVADDRLEAAAELGARHCQRRRRTRPLFALAGPGYSPSTDSQFDDGLKARRAGALGMGLGPAAELVCQACGVVSQTALPRFRPDTMPTCSCGGRRQIVRVRHHIRNLERP
jgi:hypothetical protein